MLGYSTYLTAVSKQRAKETRTHKLTMFYMSLEKNRGAESLADQHGEMYF